MTVETQTPPAPTALPDTSVVFPYPPSVSLCWQMNGLRSIAATVDETEWEDFTTSVVELLVADASNDVAPTKLASWRDEMVDWVNTELTPYRDTNPDGFGHSALAADRYKFNTLNDMACSGEELGLDAVVEELTNIQTNILRTTLDRSLVAEQWIHFNSEFFLGAALAREDITDEELLTAREAVEIPEGVDWVAFVDDFHIRTPKP